MQLLPERIEKNSDIYRYISINNRVFYSLCFGHKYNKGLGMIIINDLFSSMTSGLKSGAVRLFLIFGIYALIIFPVMAAESDIIKGESIAKENLKTVSERLELLEKLLVAAKSPDKDSDKDKTQPITAALNKLTSEQSKKSKTEMDTTLVDGPSICQVSVSNYNTVSVHAQNVKISTILQELSVKSRKNIILAAGSDRVVSMTFYTVPFYKALRTMLDVNGLSYVENNNFIEVFTKEKMSKRIQGKNGMDTKIFRLNYLRPKDGLIAAQELLSADGKAQVIDDDKDIDDDDGDNNGDESDRVNKDPVYKPNKQRFALNSALVVYDYKENIEKISDLIVKLDKRPKQVLLEATVLEVTLNDDNQFGIDFAMLSNINLNNYFGFDNGGVDNFGGGNTSGGLLASDSFKGGIAVGDAALLVTALDKITDVSVLSKPKVLSLDRQRARVMVGQNVGYLETSYSDAQIVQSVKFIESGISLDVRPYIVEDGKVRLVLAPRISDVVFNELTDANNNTQKVPQENVQTVAADIVVPAGATAVIGGLFVEETSAIRTQVPGYGNIPILGAVGRSQTDKVVRKELIFLIKPIVMSDDEMESIGNDAICDSKEMLAGMRNGLLPWSKLRQCRQLNLRAYRSLLTNSRDIGFWLYRRSLQLRGDQCEVCKELSDIAEKEYCSTADDQLYKSINNLIAVDAKNVNEEDSEKSCKLAENTAEETDDDEYSLPEGIEDEVLGQKLEESEGIKESIKAGLPEKTTAATGTTELPVEQRPAYLQQDNELLEEDMYADYNDVCAGV